MTVALEFGIFGGVLIDLYDGTDGFRLLHNGWTPRRARQNPDGSWSDVVEALSLSAEGTSHNNLVANVQALEDKMRQIQFYTRRSFYNAPPIVFRAKLNNETGTRQALVKSAYLESDVDLYSPPVTFDSFVPQLTLGLIRAPFWEPTSATALTSISALNTLGGTSSAYAASAIPGDVPGRISSLVFSGATATITEIWLGLRSDLYGSKASFNPNWDFGDADASFHNNTARQTGVTRALNDQVARWTPAGGADDAMLPRVTLEMADILSAPAIGRQDGTHIALLRSAINVSGDAFRARLKYGFYDGTGASDSSAWVTSPRVTIPASGVTVGEFYYYDMGLINIPPTRNNLDFWSSIAFRIEAERTASAGGGTIDFDCLTLIPVTEGAVHLKGANVTSVLDSGLKMEWDGRAFAYAETSATHRKATEFTLYNWGIPNGDDGIYVLAAQTAAYQNEVDTLDVDASYFARWTQLRGAE